MKFSVKKTDPVMQFTMCLLHSVTNGHILHLTTTSYSEHKALGTYYREVADLVDEFIEAFQGKYGLLHDFTADYELPGEPLEYITYLKDEVAALRTADKFPQDNELQNIVDDVAQVIDSTLYKLRFLK